MTEQPKGVEAVMLPLRPQLLPGAGVERHAGDPLLRRQGPATLVPPHPRCHCGAANYCPVSQHFESTTNLRRDGLHKLTTRPTATIGTVVVEDVNMAGMLRHTAARPVDR
jgi:hypothetical protein